MHAAILLVWVVGIPVVVLAVTGVAGWRRERTLARLEADGDARVSVPRLASLSALTPGRRGTRTAVARGTDARCRVGTAGGG
jgi:hypothetical protein